MMTYGYTKCTAASSSHGAPSCEDYYHVDLSAFENFNRDNNGGAPPVIYYVYHHVDGSSPAMGGRVGHGIALQRIEGTINAQITITFTVTVRSQTMHPVEVSPAAGRFRNSLPIHLLSQGATHLLSRGATHLLSRGATHLLSQGAASTSGSSSPRV